MAIRLSHRSLLAGASGAAVLVAAGGANAAFFSFASDNDHTSWTFRGTPGAGGKASLLDGADVSDPITLLIDDSNGATPALGIAVDFESNFELAHASSTNLGPFWLHSYLVTGQFSFNDPTSGAPWLICSIDEGSSAIMTVIGQQFQWGTSGATFGTDAASSITWTATAAFLAAHPGVSAYDIGVGSSAGPDDFGFDLTVMNVGQGAAVGSGVPLATTGPRLPSADWRSEGSFSGSSGTIPAPGAGLVAAMGGLAALRRKRS